MYETEPWFGFGQFGFVLQFAISVSGSQFGSLLFIPRWLLRRLVLTLSDLTNGLVDETAFWPIVWAWPGLGRTGTGRAEELSSGGD